MTEGPEELSAPHNQPLRVRRRIAMFATGIACYLLSLVLARAPNATEAVYGNLVGPAISRPLSLVTGLVPFALAEFFVLTVVARQLVGGWLATRDALRGRRQWANALKAGALRLAQDAGLLMAAFYVLWGFNYARAPLQDRLGWTSPADLRVVELADLAAQMVSATNESYFEIHGTSDAEEPTALTIETRTMERALAQGWERARAELGLPLHSGPYGRVKTPLLTRWYEWTGIAGFYFPFTGEANLRRGIPAVDNAKMLAHEKAHQRGVGRESEANFWGFLSAARCAEPLAQYSAFAFAQRQLLALLSQLDRDLAAEIAGRRLPGVQRDVDHSRHYWRSLRSRGTEVAQSVNNAFLQGNRVEGGVRDYSMSTMLIISYARSRRGSLLH
ncbi:MAG: DUF3810 domain-containing protein [Gemmatimonadota bacterium]|nr:MAG: DUF3810 domain-containing protein [Gemmatimonadota bacterium]